ncbi:MAG: class IV adenylate cyclase [Acidobacteriota bacterium]
MKNSQEVEVKISVGDAAKVRALLRQKGFRVRRARVLERNLVLDDEAGSIRERNLLLRVRTAGKLVTCTFKGRQVPGPYKRREEREFHVDNLEECLALFAGLGLTPSFTYEKFRTEWARPGEPGAVTFDETPIGIFIELEGPARWIDSTAKELGYSRADYITASYIRLFTEWCREFNLDSRDMKFGAPENAKGRKQSI